VSFFIVWVGLWVYSSKRKHLLATLLILEFIVLGVFIYFFTYINFGVTFYSLVYLTFTACEGAIGLTILVRMVGSYGGDYFNRFSLNY
jgi:NADH-ubiquinone oxidoreductase chain 4L